MERLLQYLDELDDFYYAIALTWEKIRMYFRLALGLGVAIVAQAVGIYAAVQNPPFAVAAASLLVVSLLYWGTVRNKSRATAAA